MKKSFYILLSTLLGILIFLIIHRIIIFIYLLLTTIDYQTFAMDITYWQFIIFDYVSLTVFVMLGGWYGVWLGMHWYQQVYEDNSHPGLVGNLVDRYWPTKPHVYDLQSKIVNVREQIESDLSQFESIGESANSPLASPASIKRKVVRKRALKRTP